jgi:hypothetical protein
MRKKDDLLGMTFGRYSVVSQAENGPRGHTRWNCRCACGKEKIVLSYSLKEGTAKSCGCGTIEALTTHGHSSRGKVTSEYLSWLNIHVRTKSKKYRDYDRYGGRGITVCEQWATFEGFIKDMGYKPSTKHSLDRINNDLGYFPENCRWATKKEQSDNRSNCIKVTYRGETKGLMEWSDTLGIKYRTLLRRYHSGYPLEELFSPDLHSGIPIK